MPKDDAIPDVKGTALFSIENIKERGQTEDGFRRVRKKRGALSLPFRRRRAPFGGAMEGGRGGREKRPFGTISSGKVKSHIM